MYTEHSNPEAESYCPLHLWLPSF